MGRSLVVITLALVGLLCAAGMGVAAYVVSRDSVAVPVTQLQPAPQLTPARVKPRVVVRSHSRPIEHTPTTTGTVTSPPTTTDDHGGSGGSGNSGRGGGHGGDGGDD